MAKMTDKEAFEIIQAVHAAEARGDKAEAHRIRLRLPLAPHLAEFMKQEFGAQYLLDTGANLSEVEAQYGKDWISR